MSRIELIMMATVLFGISSCTSTSEHYEIMNSIRIGSQIWAAENLDVSKFRNGDSIPEIESQEEFFKAGSLGKPAWCYYHGDSSNRKKYGKLYNWYAVHDNRGLAPKGWHIPSDREWTILTDYLGGDSIAGQKMKSAKEWDGDNSSGFNALPGGSSYSGSNYGVGSGAYFWSSTEDSSGTWNRYLISEFAQSFQVNYYKDRTYGLSVRCIKD